MITFRGPRVDHITKLLLPHAAVPRSLERILQPRVLILGFPIPQPVCSVADLLVALPAQSEGRPRREMHLHRACSIGPEAAPHAAYPALQRRYRLWWVRITRRPERGHQQHPLACLSTTTATHSAHPRRLERHELLHKDGHILHGHFRELYIERVRIFVGTLVV